VTKLWRETRRIDRPRQYGGAPILRPHRGTQRGKHNATKPRLPRCDNFVEQGKHRSMAPGVVDVHEYGGAVNRGKNFVPKLVSRIKVMGELVSRRNQCS
jgi:hypothetical protein